MKHVVVVGLGYVGLPLSLLADRKGYEVTGLDINAKKIASLAAGKSYISDIADADIKSSGIAFSADVSVVKKADFVIICVPTPVYKNKQPNLEPIKESIKAVAPHLQKRTLIVLESTVNPGVCDEIVIPLLHQHTKFKVGQDIYLAYCPERINPGEA